MIAWCVKADNLSKEVSDTANAYSSWAMELGREVSANPLSELQPVQ